MLNTDQIFLLVYILFTNRNKNKVDVLLLFMSNFKYRCIIVYPSKEKQDKRDNTNES